MILGDLSKFYQLLLINSVSAPCFAKMMTKFFELRGLICVNQAPL